jgi:NAD(P)-dependent dehydrogenase (short-subunit alcohol dehydrogenase family)
MKYLSIFLLLGFQLFAAPAVLITGASRGIGLAIAETLSARGYHVYGTVRAPMHHPKIHLERVDLTDPLQIGAFVERIVEAEGGIDILINNAGYALGGPVECLSMEEIAEQMDVNFIAPIRMIQAVLPHMRKQGSGRIVNISSEQGVYGLPYGSLYASSKAALESLSEALSMEVLPWNIRVSIIEPGLVQTKFTIQAAVRKMGEYQAIFEGIESEIEQRAVGTLEGGQTAAEIGVFVANVVEDPSPKLRYQTSKAAEEMVSMKLKDLTGEAYLEKMKAFFPRKD